MIQRPMFKPSFHIEVVDSEGVFLLSERGHFVLRGALHCRLAPLLDGRNTADDIVDHVANEASPAEVYYTLRLLEKKGYVVEADSTLPPDRAAFWEALGLDARLAERRLQETTVALAPFGAVPVEPFASALAALNIRVGEDGDFALALTDDYLQEGLAEFNAAAVSSGRPWLLVNPVGSVFGIGPLFRPGQTGCWECLAQRLRGNREVESYLQYRKQAAAPFPVSRAAVPASVQAALHLAAIETAKAIAGAQGATDGTLVTMDLLSLATEQHALVRRPQCRCCGDPAYRHGQQPIPLTLHSQKKRFTADGGHRVASPEETVAKYARHVSPITGAVSVLARMPAYGDGPMHAYVAGHNLAVQSRNLYFLRRTLRSKSGGKGVTDAQARASGLCEALERYSGNFHGDEIRRPASYRRLAATAIHPNACTLFSPAQYERRQALNARGSVFQFVPDRFDEDAEIEWTPVWSLTAGEFKYLPTAYLYYGYRSQPGAFYCVADSNGNAAGNTLEEAILQGFMELVERDSVALWWYNRVRRPAVDLDSFDEPYIHQLRNYYRTLGREFWVIDLTADLQIPAFAAVGRRVDQAAENILLGYGAHFDPRIGVLRALTEMNQSAFLMASLADSSDAAHDDPDLWHWWRTASLANQPYLVPNNSPARVLSEYPATWSDDLREDVLRCQAIVERQGMEFLVLDQTRPDIGLPVAKVIVPGLRHFWMRLAPGRLYDVPVKLGWLEQPLREEQFNPLPMFF